MPGIIPTSIVEINEVDNGEKFYRNFSFPILELDVDTSSGYKDLKLPFNFWFLSIEYFAGPGSGAVLGDHISALIDPYKDVDATLQLMGYPAGSGCIKSDISIGDDWVYLDSSLFINQDVLDALYRVGSFLYINNAGNTEYTITEQDHENSRIRIATVDYADRIYEYGATEAYSSGSNTYRTIVAGDQINVMPTYDGNLYGVSKIGASKLAANTPFRILYEKASGSGGTRKIVTNIEGLIGEG